MFIWRSLKPETLLAALAALAFYSPRGTEHSRPGASTADASPAQPQPALPEKR